MARSRNIKPGFFVNEDLAEIDPLGRLLFIGLWTISDHKGDLEWRPKRIKAQLLPYDNCDIKELVNNLDKSRFVTYYSVSSKTYLHINNFSVHQHPHPNEKKKGSDIPVFDKNLVQVIDSKEVTINHDKSRQVTDNSVSNRADSLLSDSLLSDSLPPVLAGLNTEAWKLYEKYRSGAKIKKLKPMSVEKQQTWLVEQGPPEIQMQIVEETIKNGWQGLFELRGKINAENQRSNKPSLAERASNNRQQFDAANGSGDGVPVGADGVPVWP